MMARTSKKTELEGSDEEEKNTTKGGEIKTPI
jgi:hypothetical protein